MSAIFVSYSRTDRELVKVAADDLHDMGHTVWFDRELTGGHQWWNDILQSIRACDVFVFALSPIALDSYPCSLEYKYADALGKLILPILLRDVSTNLLPDELSKIQFVDYRDPEDRASVKALARAMDGLPTPAPLPDPLPKAPDAPISALNKLSERIDASQLPFQEQTALVFELKALLNNDGTASDARVLLNRLLKHPDLRASIAPEITAILANRKPSTRGPSRQDKQPALPQPITDGGRFATFRQNPHVPAIRFVLMTIGITVYFVLFGQSLITAGTTPIGLLIWTGLGALSILVAFELPLRLPFLHPILRILIATVISVSLLLLNSAIGNGVSVSALGPEALVQAILLSSGFTLGSTLRPNLPIRMLMATIGLFLGLWVSDSARGYGYLWRDSIVYVITGSAFVVVLILCAFAPDILQFIRIRRTKS